VSLVFVTQAVDPEDPVLGATVAQVRALAARVDRLAVLARRIAPEALPANCVARSFAAPTQALRGARFLAALAPELARRPLAVVVHMSPIYLLLAEPLARPLRVPLLLWFTQQGARRRRLRAAERAAAAILTVDARSVPLRSTKVRAIGHGIDVAAFPCGRERRPPLRALVGLGRYAPVKGWETALRALARLPEARLELHGPVLTERDRAHLPALQALARKLGVADRVQFGGPVPYREVPALLAAADALVDATAGNAADKVVFEACAACLPAFCASPVFDRLLPEALRFPAGDADALAARIRAYPGGDGAALRARVAAEHSVEHWADAVLAAARRARGR